MFPFTHYQKAESLAHALTLLRDDPDARPLAGGTDVLLRLRDGHPGFERLVDIRGLPELAGLSFDEARGLRIGAGATFSRVAADPGVELHARALGEAAASVGGPQIRNVATLGGNIANGAVSADSVPALLVLDARLELADACGARTVPVAGFHTGPGRVALGQGELITAVEIPATSLGLGSAYVKYAMREAMDIATIGCAAAVRVRDGLMTDVRLAFGVAAPTPVRCPLAEAAGQGRAVTEETLADMALAVLSDVSPRTSWRASREFRLHIIKTLTKRVVALAASRCPG